MSVKVLMDTVDLDRDAAVRRHAAADHDQRWLRTPSSNSISGPSNWVITLRRAAGVKSPGGERRWKRRGIDRVRCGPWSRTKVNRPMTCRDDRVASKPGGVMTLGIGRGVTCLVPDWRPAYRRREHGSGFEEEQENLSSRCEGRSASGGHHECQSTDAGHRGRDARSRDEGSVMGLDRRCVGGSA